MSRKRRIEERERLPEVLPPKRIQTPVSVSFRHVVQPGDAFCLSTLGQDEVREVVDCLRQLNTLTWQQILQQSGKGPRKAGLAYTLYPDHALRGVSRPAVISPDIRIAAVRASQKIRVFGVYIEHVFHILWFDRNHEIVPA
ncbi:MAG: hypothetical protein L0Y71_04625 [Gemmataceae bacterium]|nr:hypothetical protein [Gemmataceae bacterium]